MLKKNYLLIWGLWLINIILFLVILLVPKGEALYKIFFLFFVLCLFINPLLLGIFAYLSHRNNFDIEKQKVMTLPLGLSIMLILTTQIFFVKSLVEAKRPLLIISSIIISLVLIGLSAFMKLKKISPKMVLFIMVCSLVIYFAYLIFCIDLSYNYSILW